MSSAASGEDRGGLPRAPHRHAELALCLTLAAALVLLRAIPFVRYEFTFDSDQAIVGLMAKHLSELRSFPLFFYGQNYMLGVQAWMAAPFFWIGGPTIAMLRTPLLLLNVAVALLMVIAIARRGVRPAWALAAAMPIVATTPAMSAELLYTLGASIEPFVYVLGLWVLRTRPLAFGLLASFGILHREFTVFAVAAFAVAGWRSWRAWRLPGAARALAGAAGVWLLIDQVKRHVNTYGPGGGAHATGSLTLQFETVLKRLSFEWQGYIGRLGDVLTEGLPGQFGADPRALAWYGVNSTLTQGSHLAGAAFAAALVLCVARLVWISRRPGASLAREGSFFLYIGLVAVATILAYGLGGGLPVGAPVVLSYVLFSVLLPIAIFGWFFLRDVSRWWPVPVGVLIAVWAASNVADNARLIHEYATAPPVHHHRIMADYLTGAGIRYGRAVYWDAYAITFLAQERVILTPDDVIRISVYKAMVDAHADTAVTLRRQPCQQGTRVDVWCVTGAR